MNRSPNLGAEIERSARELLEQVRQMPERPALFSLQTMEVEESLRQFLARVDRLEFGNPAFGQRTEV